MTEMTDTFAAPYQISDRFRKVVEARIERLERDAEEDIRLIPTLLSEDHKRRQRLLAISQIEQAIHLRVRLSLTEAYAGDPLASSFQAFA
ncbi:hypothetical protein [Granulicella sibirica]|uniref:Uncharacterized protein n=1 Tax=Granulicella sibirica TaxID=2479048 RepID=A0A4Q0T9Q1_9BACT|nr:hypothetical protein [Granulicella sibirica]RXH58838.1 hypothetical protein GRAN_2148 [Granulicella sibirica]